MQFHRNAKLGLAGRHELVRAIEAGFNAQPYQSELAERTASAACIQPGA